jgi:hypothetical protein
MAGKKKGPAKKTKDLPHKSPSMIKGGRAAIKF